MMKNRESSLSAKLVRPTPFLLLALISACGGENSETDPSHPNGRTLAERVAYCESFSGEKIADCPAGEGKDCNLVESVKVLYDGNSCELETDSRGAEVETDLCLAADMESQSPFGNRGVYRRVSVGETADDPVTPVEPEEVLRLYMHESIYGWERCTEATSEYCACALQFEYLDG